MSAQEQQSPVENQQQEPKAPEESQQEDLQKEAPEAKEALIKQFPMKPKTQPLKTVFIVLVIMIAGVATGFLLSSRQGKAQSLKSTEAISEAGVVVGDVFGNPDKETFRDEAEGVLAKGGIDGEGSHRILRPGGESQNVYITSSVVDLDQFQDHKVRIWGETFSAQKAGWLMDVGRVEILELNAEKPFEE